MSRLIASTCLLLLAALVQVPGAIAAEIVATGTAGGGGTSTSGEWAIESSIGTPTAALATDSPGYRSWSGFTAIAAFADFTPPPTPTVNPPGPATTSAPDVLVSNVEIGATVSVYRWTGTDPQQILPQDLQLLTEVVAASTSVTFSGLSLANGDKLLVRVTDLSGNQSPHSSQITVAIKSLNAVLISGPSELIEGSSGTYAVLAIYSDASSAQVAASIQLDGSAATLSGNTLTAASVTTDQSVTLSASVTDGGVTQSGLSTVIIRNFIPVPRTLNLHKGWNLIGNSSIAPIDLSTALTTPQAIASVWKWVSDNTGSRWAFLAPNAPDGGASYARSKGYLPLASIAPGEGFWINVTANGGSSITLPGDLPVGSDWLKNAPAGWKLFATGSATAPRTLNTYLAGSPHAPSETLGFRSLWAWSAAQQKWYFYAPSLDSGARLDDYVARRGFLDFLSNNKLLEPDTGFWLLK